MASMGISSANGDLSTAPLDSSSSTDTAEEIEFVQEFTNMTNKSHQCELCCQGAGLLNKIMKFGGVVNESKKLFCIICDKGFKNKRSLKKHILRFHKEDGSSTKPVVETILDTILNPKQRSRSISCSKKKHSNTSASYLCETCDTAFTFFNQFTQHCLSHSKMTAKKLQFRCTSCKKKFMYKKALKEHVCTLRA